jgi:alkaline phosphatase
MEIARDRGLSTGVVSTAEITDATPSGPSAHMSRRECQGPANTRQTCPLETKAAGGLGSIAEQQVDSGFDLFLGGGRSRFTQTLDNSSRTVLQYATEDKGYRYVSTAQELAEVTSLAPGERLLGLFNNSNMTTMFAPLVASQNGAGSSTTRCSPQNRGNEPTLKEMTQKAIDLLKGNPKGFVLQVESASIDKRAHNADPCGQIGETIALDEAVEVALEFQASNPDTLILISADHGQSGQIVAPNTTPRGLYATLQTVDGAPIRVSYATGQTAPTQNHSGITVPVFAKGPRAADIVGTIDQTEIFSVLTNTRTGDGPVPAAQTQVGGEVPPTLELSTAGSAIFDPFIPGLAQDYTTSLATTVTSSAGDATLSVADPSATATGHLVNGQFSLPQPLQAGVGGTFAPVGGSAAPTTLKVYDGPVSNDPVAVGFRQSIGAADPLRTGTYAKTLTLTLSTTTP